MVVVLLIALWYATMFKFLCVLYMADNVQRPGSGWGLGTRRKIDKMNPTESRRKQMGMFACVMTLRYETLYLSAHRGVVQSSTSDGFDCVHIHLITE